MMRGAILVTRPAPDGERLQHALQQMGWQCVWQPLITITAGTEQAQVPEALRTLTEADWLIAVSKHAVYYANEALQHAAMAWPCAPRYIAVGGATAAMWQTMNTPPIFLPEQENSEGILALPELSAPHGCKVVILRGQSGREQLATELTRRGAKVQYLACYQRKPLTLDGQALLMHWKQSDVKLLLITSGEMLQQMVMLAGDKLHWLTACGVVVVSQRIADMAAHAGFKKIIVSNGVTPQAIDEALHRLIKV